MKKLNGARPNSFNKNKNNASIPPLQDTIRTSQFSLFLKHAPTRRIVVPGLHKKRKKKKKTKQMERRECLFATETDRNPAQAKTATRLFENTLGGGYSAQSIPSSPRRGTTASPPPKDDCIVCFYFRH
jgi:hypothetical protein